MKSSFVRNVVLTVFAFSSVLVGDLWAAERVRPVDFVRDVQPILRQHCDRCHGQVNQEASLTLATADGLLGVADSDETIVVPGKADASLLMSRMTDADVGDLMPLDSEPLGPGEIDVVRRWIEQGAAMPDAMEPETHWAYVRPKRPHPPESTSSWARNPIDRFVEAQLHVVGFEPSVDADAATLARRAALALTGLPATLQQIEALEAGPTDENYDDLVDELIRSPAFGQHWARHWLDLARYADSNGYQADQLRDAWAYRDWVVDALNAGMPFDQFVTEQLAGDLLPDPNVSTRIATGFHRTPTCNVEAGVHPESNRVQQVFDRVNTTATVFLGSTLECAQCHDHKYDPFTQKDYYQLFAYFNNTPIEVEKDAGVQYDFVGPKMSLPLTAQQEQRIAELTAERAAIEDRRDRLIAGQDLDAWIDKTTQALAKGAAKWVTPTPRFSTAANESFEIQEDGSVLLTGSVPSSSVYRFEFELVDGVVSAIRLDTLRHDQLPGGGPGRGDAVRTNFVLNELEVAAASKEQVDRWALGEAKASFSQQGWRVDGAIDGNPKTGWAIAPRFSDGHWAEFRVLDPQRLSDDQKLVITLDQHFGRGRVIGRPKVSLLVGPPETVGLPPKILEALTAGGTRSAQQIEELKTFHANQDPVIKRLKAKIDAIDQQLVAIEPPTTLVMVETDQPRESFVMQRGDYLAQGEEVDVGTPQALHPLDSQLPKNRLGLAQWLVSTDNPLLARVTVNRLWAQMFGRALVTTQEDFGTQSDPPSHPELLDWLAVEFQESGWSIKHLIRLIAHSSTFRQASVMDSMQREQDAGNKWLSRGPRFRMPAETIRDNALAIAGLLSTKRTGPPIMPYQPDGIWRAVGRNQPKWSASATEDRFRRGLYVVWKRGAPYPSFVTFDAPDRASCTVKRARTNTPLQALVLLNDQAYAEAAIAFAQRVLKESPSADPETIARHAYRLATGKQAKNETVDVLVDLYVRESDRITANPDMATQRISVLPVAFRDSELDAKQVAAWFSVTSTLLNLDETITLN
ncbi:MAG: PSD1 and planctomycete cytochrome C domain-containing protein [Planctomycetota bacterium]